MKHRSSIWVQLALVTDVSSLYPKQETGAWYTSPAPGNFSVSGAQFEHNYLIGKCSESYANQPIDASTLISGFALYI